MLWTTIHFPFIMAYVLAGAALSRLVLATDCYDANVDDLTDAYTSSSKPEVSSGLRWFYCTGLGIALLSMSTRLAPLLCLPLQRHILTSNQASYPYAMSIVRILGYHISSSRQNVEP